MRARSSRPVLAWVAVIALVMGGVTVSAGADESFFQGDPFSVKGFCSCCDSSPLILDLDNEGRVLTTGMAYSVQFDINGDSIDETIGWTYPYSAQGFLWMDLNSNGRVDNGRELFGTATLLPGGELARNGFDALAVYDAPRHGGNGDGWITKRDEVWRHLKLWIDWSHDAESQVDEIYQLADYGVLGIYLKYDDEFRLDGAMNNHQFRGEFIRLAEVDGLPFRRRQLIEDIFFVLDQ